MKNIFLKAVLVLLVGLLLTSCSDDKKSSTEPETVSGPDQALVGNWVLTKILSPIVTTPDVIGLSLTVEFNVNETLQFTTVDQEGTVVESGTWTTSGKNLTITLEGSEPGTSPYSITDNKVAISAFPFDFQGTVVMASLEFEKAL